MKKILLFLLVSISSDLLSANEIFFSSGSTPFKKRFSPELSLTGNHKLILEGHNAQAEPVLVVIRIDDAQSFDYRSRINLERYVNPGSFHLEISLNGLKKPSKQILNIQKIVKIIVFTADKESQLLLSSVQIVKTAILADNIYAYDLGHEQSPVMNGFKRLTIDSAWLTGKYAKAIHRPMGDDLLIDGIKGIDRIQIPLPNGQWALSLWTEDLGEWEFIPHDLKRKIVVNGETLLDTHLTPQLYLENTYLAGYDKEYEPGDTAWDLFGLRRGGRIDTHVEVTDQLVTIDLTGESASGKYLSGVLIRPVSDNDNNDPVIEQQRWYLSNWTIVNKPYLKQNALEIGYRPLAGRYSIGDQKLQALPEQFITARGGFVQFDLEIRSAKLENNPFLVISPPSLARANMTLEVNARIGHWRLERPDSSATLLWPTADHLKGDLSRFSLSPNAPTRLNITVNVPINTKAGIYTGNIQLSIGGEIKVIPYQVKVLAMVLPPIEKPVGLYLERLPYYSWFKDDWRLQQDKALECDLLTLKSFGLSAVSVPIEVSNPVNWSDAMANLQKVKKTGFNQPVLSYTLLKELLQYLSVDKAIDELKALQVDLSLKGIELPMLAVVDEPHIDSDTYARLNRLTAKLHSAMPNAILLGQLNNPGQSPLLPFFNTVMINTGFGIDKSVIQKIQKQQKNVWLYNISNSRAAAGFYLWKSQADGYLQWHARMPTADPFDPTDGREADIQYLMPQRELCPKVPDIHGKLLHIAEGIQDYRWLIWLEKVAENNKVASQLLKSIQAQIPVKTDAVEGLSFQAMSGWRQEIITVAQGLLTVK